jgi:hypothetical protein
MKIEFFLRFLKNIQIPNFIKIRLVGAELFNEDGRTDRQTGMTKLVIVFRNFANAQKEETALLPGRGLVLAETLDPAGSVETCVWTVSGLRVI